MSSWLDSDLGTGRTEGWPRAAWRILVACMALLAAATGWLVLTRPVHRIEGDFLLREDRAVLDAWLVEQLQSPVAETRARAFLALGRVAGRGAADRLASAMADPAPSVRANAAFAAGNLYDSRGPDGAPPQAIRSGLLALLADDDRVVVTRAAAALGKAVIKEAIPQITSSAAPIATSMTAVMRVGATGESDFVAEYLDSDDQDSRWAAALAAAELELAGGGLVRRRLLPLLTDENEFVRAAALRAAAVAPQAEEMHEAVQENLSHTDPKVRFEARLATAAIEGGPVQQMLPAGEPDLGLALMGMTLNPLLAPGDYQRVAKTLGVRLRMSTSLGDFDIELDYDQAPLTSEHFRRLAGDGALDGSRFFAVRPNGYAAAGAGMALIRSELNPKPFLRGSLGLLRQGDDSGGGFFLCHTALPLADGRYVNFGRLVSGDQRLDSIATGAEVLQIREIQ